MELRPGMTVVDACAGAGGKTLHIADLLTQKGKIHCFDIHAIKLKNLQKRANRIGLRIHQTHLAPKITHWDSFDQIADRVLIDAPCTGLGTIRRKPILKWRLNERWYATIRKSQQQVLQQYAPMCKKGGYSFMLPVAYYQPKTMNKYIIFCRRLLVRTLSYWKTNKLYPLNGAVMVLYGQIKAP